MWEDCRCREESSPWGFEDVVDSGGFVFAHHNDRDMDSFRRFRRRAQDRYIRNQQNREGQEIVSI